MKKWCQVIRSAAPVTQNHLSKPENLRLQNATPLRKSAPGPPNSSDEHVSCTAPATENASLQILFKCPTPAIVFVNATKPSRFAHFWQGPQSLPPATRNDIWTSRKWPRNALRTTTRTLFRHRNFQKWSAPGVFCTFLTSKCASRLNGVHFFDIATSKSGPSMVCFVHFDFEMCFVPQWRCVLYILTSKCASCHNGVQFFISHLARWLRTRRFSGPAFRPSGATNHWKNAVFRDFPTFSRTCIFSLLLFSLLLFSSLWLFPSLLFICPYRWKFDF